MKLLMFAMATGASATVVSSAIEPTWTTVLLNGTPVPSIVSGPDTPSPPSCGGLYVKDTQDMVKQLWGGGASCVHVPTHNGDGSPLENPVFDARKDPGCDWCDLFK
jgi:hypothetical protein